MRPEDLVAADSGFGFRVSVVEPLGPHILLTGEAEGSPCACWFRQTSHSAGRRYRALCGRIWRISPGCIRRPGWRWGTHERTVAELARGVLRANDRGGYTVPTDRLYPFQWNWDSGFVAMGWATFDEARAFREIDRLFEGQWDDGLVPQIVFHAPSGDYFPGPEVWGIDRTPPTSGITQPPILACAVRRLWSGARDRVAAEARTASLYLALIGRIDGGRGRVILRARGWLPRCIPGRPAWTTAPPGTPRWHVCRETKTVIHRRDTRLWTPRCVRAGRSISGSSIWSIGSVTVVGSRADAAGVAVSVADVGTNAILLRAERDLLVLAGRFGTPATWRRSARASRAWRRALSGLWSAARGLFCRAI